MELDISLDYGLTLLAALLIGTGFVLQQQSAQREPASRFLSLKLITDLLRQPRWLAGIGAMIGGQVLAAWSIGNLSLAFVEPLLTTNLVFALILAVPIAKAKLRFWEIFGAAVLCTGVALLSASRSAKPIGLSFGSVTHWPAAAVIAAIAFAAVHAGRLHPGRARAMLTGTGAGLVFGIQDALTRQTLEILSSNGVAAMFTTWAPYALVGAGATGIWLMQSAFNAGPLPLSLPAISAGEPVVGILLGILVFGDRIQITPGELALQAGGIVALVVGVIIVGRAPALSQLRSWTPPSLPHISGSLPAIPTRPGRSSRPPAEGRGRRARRRASAGPGAAEAPSAARNPDAVGPPGTVGAQGTVGTPGNVGAQGTVGTPGTVGAQDTVGTPGTVGAQGTVGTPGTVGAQGTVGTQGAVGAPETVGASATSGAIPRTSGATSGTPGPSDTTSDIPGDAVGPGDPPRVACGADAVSEPNAAAERPAVPEPGVVPEPGARHGDLSNGDRSNGDARLKGRAAAAPRRIADGPAEHPQSLRSPGETPAVIA